MKHFVKLLIAYFLLTITFQSTHAQKLTYTTRGGISLGFGLGGVYQQSDIANSRGVGYDFTFGTPLYRREGAFFAADWKFRFLAGENKAYDHRINADGTFSNIDYKFFSYDIELGLILNRLRERTRIVVSGFAGAGITHGRTFTDLYNEKNAFYDFSSIDPGREKNAIYQDLVELSDGDFETRLENKASLLPTAGLYLGYQFTPSFSLGIEHKTNFSLSEENSFTSINLDNRVENGSPMDMNHYTTLGFVWKLSRSSGGRGRTERMFMPDTPDVLVDPTTTMTQNEPAKTVRIVEAGPPTVKITSPGSDPYRTSTGLVLIRADIRNVGSEEDIFFYQETDPMSDFSYNDYSNVFSARAELKMGENHFRIGATNKEGSSEDRIVVIREKQVISNRPVITSPEPVVTPEPQPDPNYARPAETPAPFVQFINPDRPVSVQENVYSIRVHTQYVRSRNDISLNINGNRISNFSYSSDGVVTARVNLREGVNSLEITGRNEAGTRSDRETIEYSRPVKTGQTVVTTPVPAPSPVPDPTPTLAPVPCKEPVIKLSSSGHITTRNQQYVFSAGVDNVSDRSQVRLSFNGRDVGFEFTGNTMSYRASLNPGDNRFTVTAINDCGRTSRNLSVNADLSLNEPCKDPELDVNLRVVNAVEGRYTLTGKVFNINSKSEISLTINGKITQDFSFTPATGAINANFRFNPGTINLIISTRNDCGDDNRNFTVNVAEPCKEPVIEAQLTTIKRTGSTHRIAGTIHNIKSEREITLRVDGSVIQSFNFDPDDGGISAFFNFAPGTHNVVISAANECGSDSRSLSVQVNEPEEEVESPGNCGTRINPGNADWQFCLVTPRGNYDRQDLKNKSFQYSGPASSLFISPTAGGGYAIIGGKAYPLKPGQYYLFTGRLTVKVSSQHPGSMGQWWVCVESDRAPVSGNGNKRPKSPCER